MGRTIPPFRPALENEIETWKQYRRGLRPEDRPCYDKIMQFARKHADAGSLAARPLISEVVFFSALLEQQKKIELQSKKIEKLEKAVKNLQEKEQGAKNE